MNFRKQNYTFVCFSYFEPHSQKEKNQNFGGCCVLQPKKKNKIFFFLRSLLFMPPPPLSPRFFFFDVMYAPKAPIFFKTGKNTHATYGHKL